MPEPEFESYLSLLSKLLRLTHGQRVEITAELRDHLEERLHELQAQGHERDRAIELALEELGDAAALAVDFTHPHLTRRRRQIMRYSIYSVAVITATFVLAAFYWPVQRQEPSVQVVAQAPPQKAEATAASVLVEALSQRDGRGLPARSRRSWPAATCRSTSWKRRSDDVLEFLSSSLELDFVVDQRYLQDNGIDPTHRFR